MRPQWFRGPVAIIAAILLAGCIPFPFPPFGPFPGMGGEDLIVENATDAEWVLRVTTDQFPIEYAIPADTTGTAYLYGASLEEIALLDRDCDELTELTWEEGRTAVRIGEGGSLAVTTAADESTAAPLVEYYECGGGVGFAEPEGGDPVADATGALIIVGGDGSAWQLNPADASLSQLVAAASNGLDGEHAVSPDGSRVAFSRYDDSGFSSDLYLAMIGAAPEEAGLLAEDGGSPAWSPDGSRIAFLDFDPFAGGSALAVIDAEGGAEPIELAERASVARWSPDGTRLAYIIDQPDSVNEPTPAPGELWVVNADGTDARRLAETGPFSGMPSWSPDGTRIAFVSGEESGAISIYDLGAKRATVVASEESAYLSDAIWSPDGERIAFVASSDSLFSASAYVGVVDADGGPIQAGAEQDDAYFITPTWSPDGEWIAVARSSDGMALELLLLEPGGTDVRVVAYNVQAIADWRDDVGDE